MRTGLVWRQGLRTDSVCILICGYQGVKRRYCSLALLKKEGNVMGRKDKLYRYLLGILLLAMVIVPVAGCGTVESDEQMTVELSRRQKEILKAKGLPTDYGELTDTQKNVIVSIEALLIYLEEKYEEEFCYISYSEAGNLEEEHLEAYPVSGLYSDVVTVYRTYEDGAYHYEDDYQNILIRPLYESRVRQFTVQTFPEEGVKVFCDIKDPGPDMISGPEPPGQDKKEQDTKGRQATEENVLRTASAVTYIFIADNICTESEFHDFTDECAKWLEDHCQGVAAQLCLRLTDAQQWESISRSDYEDKLREDIFTAEAQCGVSASGKIMVSRLLNSNNCYSSWDRLKENDLLPM